MDILGFQSYVVFLLQTLQVSSLLIKLLLYCFFCHFHWLLHCFQLFCSSSRKSSSFGNFIFTVRSSFYGCFQSLTQIKYVQLPYISCYCTRILLLITILFSHFANSLHNVARMLWLPDWFILFDHLSESDILWIMFLFLVPLSSLL